MSLIPSIILIAVTTAAACAVPGVFLVLRRMSMVAEGISHAVFPGLVLALLILGAFRSPFLVVGPAVLGLFLVFAVQAMNRTRLFAGDAPLGVIFPALFSIGVIIVSRRYSGLPLSESTVLTGDINYAALTQLQINGMAVGPRAFYVMLVILLVNILFTALFFKELKLTTFDPDHAASVGFGSSRLYYLFMTTVSITIVGAFEAVGAVLVVGLLVAPAASAFLLSKRLESMLLLSVLFAVLSAIIGFWAAYYLNAATSGAMAMMTGIIFLLTLAFAPRRGLVSKLHIRARRRISFAEQLLVMHLIHHVDGERVTSACSREGVRRHIRWEPAFAEKVIRVGLEHGYIAEVEDGLVPTMGGRQLCSEALLYKDDVCECGIVRGGLEKHEYEQQ
ncbi:MAG: metal ABC transporter permease [Spirochaeta sp.]|nr:metal ABC transporter permease [Spirochaeta sp.]